MATGFTKQDFKKGQKVYFGRGQGEQTLAVVEKLNPAKAKVKTLEDRGNGRGSAPGAVWNVPYSLLRPADPDAKPGAVPPPVELPPLTYNPFAGTENALLEALVGVYSGLSPENLSGDGELPISHIRRRRAELERQRRGIIIALGREVDEVQAYGWLGSKSKFEVERQKRTA